MKDRLPNYMTLAGLGLVLCSFPGCAAVQGALDWLFLPGPDGSPPPATGAGGILNWLIPGSGAVLAGAGAVWQTVRKNALGKLAQATFATVEKFATDHAGDGKELKTALANAHQEAGVYGVAKDLADRLTPKA